MNRTVSDQSATSGDGAGRGNGGLLLWGPAGGRRGVPRGSGAQFTTTSCVRHCAEGEWGAKRAGGGRETVEVGSAKGSGGCSPQAQCPTARQPLAAPPRPHASPRVTADATPPPLLPPPLHQTSSSPTAVWFLPPPLHPNGSNLCVAKSTQLTTSLLPDTRSSPPALPGLLFWSSGVPQRDLSP